MPTLLLNLGGKTNVKTIVIHVAVLLALAATSVSYADDSLIAHWPLIADGRDTTGNNLHAVPRDVDFTASGPSGRAASAASLNGRSSTFELADHDLLDMGESDFTIATWVCMDQAADDIPGDIVSRYDPSTRRGFHLSIKTNAGVTFSQPNSRQLQFGIDDNRTAESWTDCGRPGNAILAFALCSFDGHLYAGTCEPGRGESGHVYRYAGGQQWIDCGSPDQSNAVTAFAVFKGQLYAATGKYRLAGSSLPESENSNPGGRVFRYDPPSNWIDCGQLPNTEAVGGLTVFRDNLYATSLYHPPGFFRYGGGKNWHECENPTRPAEAPGDSPHMRVEAIAPFNGALYASTYDGGRVFRFDGQHWTDCGQLGENTQTYSFAVYRGQLHVGTWPSGRVYRFEELNRWEDCGRLGEELEVMGMLVHNGRLIAGTLPLADVYQYDGGSTWRKLARLDSTADVRYRRAWCLAEHGGKVFCSTLPSGKVFSWQAGQIAMADRELTPGWHHVAAVRKRQASINEGKPDERGLRRTELAIFLDGHQVAQQSTLEPPYNLSTDVSLQIGFGPNDYFKGRLADVRLYGRALTKSEIAAMAP